MKLRNTTIQNLPDSVLVPTYDRSALTPGIVHIGVGNFHRAHQAWYLHRLMQEGKAQDWAIIGAGVRDYDSAQRSKLEAQDYLTTLIELDPSGTSAEVVGSMIDYVPIEDGNQPLIQQMTDPRIRIVSLTVTEGGYYLDPADKRFAPTHPDIAFDAQNPTTPKTAFGAIVAALKARRDAGSGPFTCMSCDNLPGNGRILKEVVIGLANLSDPDLARWIESNVSFPNSMVDCIVPATGPNELELVQQLGVDDMVPVTHENFRQWVIEDAFCAGRPAWEDVGATISDRVHDFEAMKLQLLNGGHQIVANPAEIVGISTISEAMEHRLIKRLFRKIALAEIAPHIETVPGCTPEQYVDLVDVRFSNPAIVDTVRRVAFDGSSRHTGALLPLIRLAASQNAPIDGLALSQALWARMCTGTRENGSSIEPNDPVWEQLMAVANEARQNPQAWLEQREFYGSLADDPNFSAKFALWLKQLHLEGVEATIVTYLNT
ncbi:MULTISPECIES: mannitol dehydrogenase family protein [Halocynthiibacter]|uniref:Mannitol dehydrogenase family protein n=1 Tax=Halocynthiibacter halioticoli TaxID=2986804 RepID=A0AAE3IXR3_9RHOB|nr:MULTISPECIES: mannitol dehydrogenase family protein [Halocynthiibacter]MCV6823959.1 mannitol dehydrogenase family protein [Halocynthiibacter halioticoli]MCW4056960.1 mannitol dehydrogenase family protein [Halocynthiibacter sp. SDUM655004]